VAHANVSALPAIGGKGARTIEVLLLAAIYVQGLFGLIRMLGPFELGFGSERVTQHIPTGLLFASNLYLYIPVQLLSGSQNQFFLRTDISSFGGGSLPASSIPHTANAALFAADVVRTLTFLIVTILLLQLVRSLRTGDPFTADNARRLVTMALWVAIGGESAEMIQTLGVHLTGAPLFDSWTRLPIVISVRPLVYGVALGVVAAVFRHGTALREESEGLV
jgi:hypothetical protein